jgi:hypothetical protein
VLVRLGLARQRLRHEADLYVRLDVALEVRVEDAVDDRPVVDRLAARVFRVGVGASPLQRGRAVAGGEQVVRAEERVLRPDLAELGQQLLAVLHVGVVRLIAAEETPDGVKRGDRLLQVDLDRHWE